MPTANPTVIDDFLRLMYVEYEPTWEWRFIKEVFHRDPLVGVRGFRTFLRSSDPNVRTSDPLFLASIAPKRSEFLANDVIFLGDMPASALNERFCDLAREFVTQFGGGLVIISGPRFGPGQLAETKLADILPVVVDPLGPAARRSPVPSRTDARCHDNYKFMQLGESDPSGEASRRGWDNMGPMPWYQPVKWKHPLATVLAEHPTDLTADGKSHQPLIAIREFPSGGKVVYLGFNETWRLRRQIWRAVLPPILGPDDPVHRPEQSHRAGKAVRRQDRQAAIQARRSASARPCRPTTPTSSRSPSTSCRSTH